MISAAAIWLVGSQQTVAQEFNWALNPRGNFATHHAVSTVNSSGGIYTAGHFEGIVDFDPGPGVFELTSDEQHDVFISSLNSNGTMAWAISFGGPLDDAAVAIAQDGTGNIYVTGTFQGTVDFDPGVGTYNLTSSGGIDFFVCKLSSAGQFHWAKGFGSASSADVSKGIAVDPDGNVLLTGNFLGTLDFDPGAGTTNLVSAGSTDIFIFKLDPSGDFLWAKQIGNTAAETCNDIHVDAAGGAYITGSFSGTVDFDPNGGLFNLASAGSTDIFVCKLDASGNLSLAKSFGGTSEESGSTVKVDLSGNIYVAGNFQGTADFDPGAGNQALTSAGSTDIFLGKYDATGNFIWAKRLGGGAADRAFSMAVDGAGNAYTTGDFVFQADFDPGPLTYNLPARESENTFISKLDASGNFVWAKNIYGDPPMFFNRSRNSGYSIAVDGAGNVITTGEFYVGADFDPGDGAYPLESPLGNNIFTIKLNSSGSFVFAKDFGHTASGEPKSLAFDGTENIYATGSFSGTLVFDWGLEIEVTSAGLSDIFVTKQYEEGEYLWAVTIGGSSDDGANAVAYDPSGNVYITGYFGGTVDFDPGPGLFELTSAGGSDIFVCKLGQDGSFIWAKRIGGLSADISRTLALDNEGNIIIAGTAGNVDLDPGPGVFNSSFAQSFYCKLDADGNFITGGNYATSPGSNAVRSVTTNAAGDIYITGEFSGTTDFDPGPDEFNLTPDGLQDIFVTKLNASGGFLWAKRIGGDAADLANAVASDKFDNVYITGGFRGTVDFDPGSGVHNLFSSINTGDIFIAKLNSSGGFVWAKSMSGSLDDSGNSISADIGGNTYVSGYFHGTVDFDPGPGIFDLTAVGESDMFIAKLDLNGNFMWAESFGTDTEDVANSITVTAAGHVYMAGTATGILADGWHDQGGDVNIYVLRLAIVDEPTVQASNIEFSSFSTNSVVLNYTGGNGFNRLVLAREGSPIDSEPVFRQEYEANNVFGSGSEIGTGNFVVGQGPGPLTVSGLSPGTTYHFRIFEFNGTHFDFDAPRYNTDLAVGNPASTSTLTQEPSAHPANFTGEPPVGASNTSITLSFTAASTISSGYGYVILRREDGSAPTVAGMVDRVAPTALSLPPGTTLIADISSSSTDVYVDGGLSANVAYTYLIIPYNYNGSASETYNYKTDGTPLTTSATPVFSTTSDIIEEPTFVYPANISYSTYQENDLTYNNSLEAFQFTLRDGGNDPDADNAPTTVSSITFLVTNGSPLKRIAIYDGTNEIAETASGGSALTFSSLALTASDDNAKTFSLRVSFHSTVTDNDQFSFAITGAVAVAGNSDLVSADGGGAVSSISGDNNRIEVTASKIVFTTQPPSLLDVNVPVSPSPTLETLDGLDNRDLDYSSSVVVNNTGSLAMVNLPVAFTSGAMTFPGDFQFTSYGEAMLSVSSGSLTDGKSNEFVVRAGEPGVQPNDLQFSDVLANSLRVTFTASTDNPAGYIAFRKQGGFPLEFPEDGATYSAGQNIMTSKVIYAGSNITFADADLTGGTMYYYSIFAYNGEGQAINYLSTAPLQGAILTTPVAPTGVEATDKTASHFLLVWQTTPSATSYELDISLAPDFSTFIEGYNGKPVTGNEWNVEGLQPNTDHYIRLRAVNASGESAHSAAISVRTLEGSAGVLAMAVPVQASEGENIVISVAVTPGAEVPVVRLHSRGITADEFDVATLTSTSNTYKMVVTPAMLDELGLEYFFEASDQTGTVRHPNNGFIYRRMNSGSSGTSIPFAPGFNGRTESYQMFSIPYLAEDRSIAAVFNELGAYDNKIWRLFHYDGSSQKYLEHQAGLASSVEVGNGYWFNSRDALGEIIQVGAGTVVQANAGAPFMLSLSPGWNQIGNPYPFNISWDAVLGSEERVGSLKFFANGGYASLDVFKPWTGAFVHADEAMTLAIPVTAKTNASGRTKEDDLQPDLDSEQWLLPITLRISDLHQTSGVGMHPRANASKDKFDEITVPRFIDYVEMNTHHAEFFSPRFSTDVVPTGEEQTWIFDVRSNLEDQQGEITWDHTAIAASKSSIILIDLLDGNWVDMKTSGTYSFKHRDGRQFKILYNRGGEINPGMTLLGEAYPNPFISEVRIPLLIDEPGVRQIGIYDSFGRLIQRISTDFLQTGVQEMIWDARNPEGQEISSGMFYYRLLDSRSHKVKRFIKK